MSACKEACLRVGFVSGERGMLLGRARENKSWNERERTERRVWQRSSVMLEAKGMMTYERNRSTSTKENGGEWFNAAHPAVERRGLPLHPT